MATVQQATKRQTAEALRQLKETETEISSKDLGAGKLILFRYIAKDDTVVWDRRPMVLVLRTSGKYMLGLNFHWLPFALRMQLVHQIIRQNKTNIKNNKPLVFDYKKIKPFMRKSGMASCVRLYIKGGMSRRGNIIPPERLIEVAQLQMQEFTGIPERVLFNKVRSKR